MHMKRLVLISGCVVAMGVFAVSRGPVALAQQAPATELETLKVQDTVWAIIGGGANVVMQVGDQGVILVDTGSAAASAKTLAAIRHISEKPIRYVINTT